MCAALPHLEQFVLSSHVITLLRPVSSAFPFLLHKLRLLLSAQFHVCLSNLPLAHQNAPNTTWTHGCISVAVQWLRLWPLTSVCSFAHSSASSFPSMTWFCSLVMATFSFFVRCACSCFTSRAQFLFTLPKPLPTVYPSMNILLLWSNTSFFSPPPDSNIVQIVSVDGGKTNQACMCQNESHSAFIAPWIAFHGSSSSLS